VKSKIYTDIFLPDVKNPFKCFKRHDYLTILVDTTFEYRVISWCKYFFLQLTCFRNVEGKMYILFRQTCGSK